MQPDSDRSQMDRLDDPVRLRELRALGVLDPPAEADYDDIAKVVSAVCRSQVAAVNFVDGERHFTKAIVGMPEARGGSVPNELSFCAATVRSDDGMLVIRDTHADPAWRDHPLVTGGPKVGFYAGVSIVSRGERVGVVCAFGDEARPLPAHELEALEAIARQAAGHLELRRRNIELRELALTDPLTGLANRTLLLDRLGLAIAERRRSGDHVGVLFCDVDDFKAVNDRFGHEAGDRLLCDIGQRLESLVRETDTVARIAGDEFVVLCPRVGSEAELTAVTDRLRLSVTMAGSHALSGEVRVSVGSVLVRDDDDATTVLRRADAAMYAAKATRRESVRVEKAHDPLVSHTA